MAAAGRNGLASCPCAALVSRLAARCFLRFFAASIRQFPFTTRYVKGGTVYRPSRCVSHTKQRIGHMQGRYIASHPFARCFALFRVLPQPATHWSAGLKALAFGRARAVSWNGGATFAARCAYTSAALRKRPHCATLPESLRCGRG